ncbi:GIY-YIG nuclease family protein [Streptomyces sp. NPDC088115]|uniref:GIY-YIG nuclease family protein n=1 Tax=Streptomyces sp. NPDC088115 TaxID=3365824 RepID=UPI0037F9904D
MTFVYVIGEPNSSTVKIGVAEDVERRLRQIQYMSPVKLRVRWKCVGGYRLEQALHSHFASHRSHGEWFTFTSDPVTEIRTAVETGAAMASPVLPRPRRPRKAEAPHEALRRRLYGPPVTDDEEYTRWLYERLVKIARQQFYAFTLTDLVRELMAEPEDLRVHVRRLLAEERLLRSSRLTFPAAANTSPGQGPEPRYELVLA